MEAFGLLIILIGMLTLLYYAGKLIAKFVHHFGGGRVAAVLWVAAALSALIGIGILNFNEKSMLLAILVGVVVFVIRGIFVLLRWIYGSKVGSVDHHDVSYSQAEDDSDIFGYLKDDRLNAFADSFECVDRGVNVFSDDTGLTIGAQGPGSYLLGVRGDRDADIDYKSSFDWGR